MIDFMVISTRSTKRGVIEIYPKFIIKKSTDLMIRGGDFYAIWIEERGLWSTDEQDALQLIDRELDRYAEENRQRFNSDIKVLHMWDAESGMIDSWHKYCQKQMRDSFHTLDDKLIFSNTETNKKDYASKKLNYPLEAGDLSAYEKLMSTFYTELLEPVNPQFLTLFSSFSTDTILYLTQKHLDLPAIHLHWKHLKRTLWLPFSTMVIYRELRITPD